MERDPKAPSEEYSLSSCLVTTDCDPSAVAALVALSQFTCPLSLSTTGSGVILLFDSVTASPVRLPIGILSSILASKLTSAAFWC